MKLRIVIFTAVLVIAVVGFQPTAHAQGTWTTLAPIPDPDAGGFGTGATEGMAVSGLGGTIVAAYGFDSGLGDTNFTRLYDVLTDTWTFGALAPGPVRSEVAYGDTSHGGKTYAIGGRSTAVVGTRLEQYDILTDTWATLAPMPTARAAAAVAVIGNGLIVMGGRTGGIPCSGGFLATVERYDILTNTWSTLASLPTARSDFAAVAVGGNGGRIFVFGGCDGGGDLADVDVYNVQTDTWSTAPNNLPGGARSSTAAGRKGNKIYVMGGSIGGLTGINEVYNIVKDSWSLATPMTSVACGFGPGRGETGTYSHGGRIYVPGGACPAFGSSTSATEVFKP